VAARQSRVQVANVNFSQYRIATFIFREHPVRGTVQNYTTKFQDWFRHFNPVGGRFALRLSNSHVRITDDGVDIFKTLLNPHCVRCLYLELHSFNYDVLAWKAARDAHQFDNDNYHSSIDSPPVLD